MATLSSPKQSSWQKAKERGKKFYDKMGVVANQTSNKLGAESFWPAPLDKESDKAAKILRSFCLDGFQPDKDHKSLSYVPAEAIRQAKGLAIFTVLRTGLGWSGAGGSGVVVAKLPNGQWSPPSGILVHTLGWGFVAGADIYDCVCIINTEGGIDGFSRIRVTIGGEVSATGGPVNYGSNLESELRHPAPVWSYTKSRGLYIGVQIDGSVIVERKSENERFYGIENVKAKQILAGDVEVPQGTNVQLWETLQAAEGASHDQNKLPRADGPTPGDQLVEEPKQSSQAEYDQIGEYHQGERMDVKQSSDFTETV